MVFKELMFEMIKFNCKCSIYFILFEDFFLCIVRIDVFSSYGFYFFFDCVVWEYLKVI